LEKRSLELDGSSSVVNQKENRYFSSISQNSARASSSADRFRHNKVEKRRDSNSTLVLSLEKRQTISTTPSVRPSTPNITHVLQSSPSVGGYSGNNNMLAQAAAQAIEKTQQMQQGRRTASLKASFEAIHGSGGMNTHELLMGRDLSSSSSHHGLQSLDRDVSFASGSQKRYKKKMSLGSASSPQTAANLLHQIQTHSNDSDELMPASYINEKGMVVEQTPEGEWSYDPNEPRYCICNQVSFGEMVACDNAEVKFSQNQTLIVGLFYISHLFSFSVLSNGFIIHVLASQHHLKANGIVQCKYYY
jgi:inhibitor of growth protein 3